MLSIRVLCILYTAAVVNALTRRNAVVYVTQSASCDTDLLQFAYNRCQTLGTVSFKVSILPRDACDEATGSAFKATLYSDNDCTTQTGEPQLLPANQCTGVGGLKFNVSAPNAPDGQLCSVLYYGATMMAANTTFDLYMTNNCTGDCVGFCTPTTFGVDSPQQVDECVECCADGDVYKLGMYTCLTRSGETFVLAATSAYNDSDCTNSTNEQAVVPMTGVCVEVAQVSMRQTVDQAFVDAACYFADLAAQAGVNYGPFVTPDQMKRALPFTASYIGGAAGSAVFSLVLLLVGLVLATL